MNLLRLSDRAYSDIVRLINEQGLGEGDRLPSETSLAEQLGVSRTIIREALVRLASDGITEARRGAGSFVTRRPSYRLAQYMQMSDVSAILGTYEVRFVLEAEAARLAALRRSEQDMKAITAAFEAFKSALLSNRPAHNEDLKLHHAIMSATSNPSFIASYDGLNREVKRIMKAGIGISRARSPEVVAMMINEHELVVEAIRLRDGDSASLAMRWHLSQGRKRLMP
jgi:GntR family transcriptional regulator, transcriptional repressor for pyruvate dehydrogenase complex